MLRLFILLNLITTIAFGLQKENPFDFSVIVGSCFKADTVKISINGQELTDNEIVESDFSTGVTKLGVYQDKDGLWILKGDEKIKKNRLTIGRQITIDIFVNGTKTTKMIDLRKGKIIFIENCFVKNENGQTIKTLTFGQFKKTVRLE
jgi:hypothetical protein